jgi:hypothetical protein
MRAPKFFDLKTAEKVLFNAIFAISEFRSDLYPLIVSHHIEEFRRRSYGHRPQVARAVVLYEGCSESFHTAPPPWECPTLAHSLVNNHFHNLEECRDILPELPDVELFPTDYDNE